MGAATMTLDNRMRRVLSPCATFLCVVSVLPVISNLLQMIGIAHADPGDTLRPRQENVVLYEQPNRSSPVVRRLSMSDRLLEFRRVGGWVRVATHGVVGWGWVPAGEIEMEQVRPAQPGQPRPDARNMPDATDEPADTAALRFRLRLDVDGSPGMEIRGECRLVTREDREILWRFTDTVPMQYDLEAEAAACRVDKKDGFGRLRVRLLRGDQDIAWATTATPYNWVQVRSRGPWGSPGASRGLGAIILPMKRK
jgi:hypothetical protein